MASSFLFIVFALLAISIPSISAVEHIVGDDKGWTANFDYQAWAKGKVFFVGDKLVFKYAKGSDNVLNVDANGYKKCSASFWLRALVTPLTSGNDVITLKTPGKKWYISSVGDHCSKGNQKLAIYVMPQFLFPFPLWAPAPAPIPSRYTFGWF